MSGPAYNAVKMGKSHWLIHPPDFFCGEGSNRPTSVTPIWKKNNAFDEIPQLTVKPLAPDQYFYLVMAGQRSNFGKGL